MHYVRRGIWWAGVVAWVFGLCERLLAARQDSSLDGLDLVLLFTAALLFVAWLFLRPLESEAD